MTMIKLRSLDNVDNEDCEIEVPPYTPARAINRTMYVTDGTLLYISDEVEVQQMAPFSLVVIETGFEDVGEASIMLVVPPPTKPVAGILLSMMH